MVDLVRTGCVYEAITDNINLAGCGPGERVIRDQFLQISQNGITRDTFYIHERGIYLTALWESRRTLPACRLEAFPSIF